MTRHLSPVAAVVLSCAVLPAAAEDPAPPGDGWTWRSSAYLFGTVDDSDGVAFAPVNGELGEPSPSASLGASADVERRGDEGDVRATGFGLVRHPFSDADRSFFLAGRLHAVRRFSPSWRLLLDDAAKLQRRAASRHDFQRNEAILGAEWRRGSADVSLRLSDRRRSLPDLPVLGFDRQGLALAASLRLAAHERLRAEAGVQRYAASTASGTRWVLSAEAASIRPRTLLALRASWFEPRSDEVLVPLGAAPEVRPAEFGSVERDAFFEAIALDEALVGFAEDGTSAELPVDLLLLDPLENDSDEWDFGRRKLALSALATRRLGARWTLTLSARLQRRRGPDLLTPDFSQEFEETRLSFRAAVRFQASRRLFVLLQGSQLTSDADRRALDYSRSLGALGLQVEF
ncbi:MAG: hypothetical protein HY317_01710 [Acidobacteria bacterium]|nr:hypothetical protein [Acidobacteriota bacterium]